MNLSHFIAVRVDLAAHLRITVCNGLAARLRASTVAIVAALALPTVSTPALAQGPGWTANSTVTKLVVTADGGVNVRLSPELTGCISNSGYGPAYASIYPSHPGINRMKADLLAAYINGTPVSLYLSDNTCKATEMILGGW